MDKWRTSHEPLCLIYAVSMEALWKFDFDFGNTIVRRSDTVRLGLPARPVPSYMNPSPPVTSMFFTSASGAKSVWPVSKGAPFHAPSSTKNRDSRLVGPVVPVSTAFACALQTWTSPLAPQVESSAAIVLVLTSRLVCERKRRLRIRSGSGLHLVSRSSAKACRKG